MIETAASATMPAVHLKMTGSSGQYVIRVGVPVDVPAGTPVGEDVVVPVDAGRVVDVPVDVNVQVGSRVDEGVAVLV